MSNEIDAQDATKLAADIVVAYLGSGDRTIEPERLPDLVRQVRSALTGDLGVMAAQPNEISVSAFPAEIGGAKGDPVALEHALRPAVPVEESVHPDYLVSLEDGKHFRSLRRHLMAKHGLTPDQYRARWGLPPDYPMVAPDYARERSEVAKRTGLGRARTPERRKPTSSSGATANRRDGRH